MAEPSRDSDTVVGSNFAFERVAVTTVLPAFSGIWVSEVTKLTTGASSSLIWMSSETSEDNSTFEILLPSSSFRIASAI